MRVYFLAERHCALKINGIYLGTVDGFSRYTEIDPKTSPFCELLPTDGALPIQFSLGEDFLFAPPEWCRLYFFRNGAAVSAVHFSLPSSPLSVLIQKRFSDTLITLAWQGGVRLFFQNGSICKELPLSEAFRESDIEACTEGFLIISKSQWMLLSQDGEILIRADGTILGQHPLQAEILFHDSVAHSAVCFLKNGKITDAQFRTGREISTELIPLALLESALIGADPSPYLAPCLQERGLLLKEYLGNYCRVSVTEDKECFILFYPTGARKYRARYFRVQTEDGKVSNLFPVE